VVRIDAIASKADSETTRGGVVLSGFSTEGTDGLQPGQTKCSTGATKKKTTRKTHKKGGLKITASKSKRLR